LAEATPSSWSLQWFFRKPLDYTVEPQNRGRRHDEEVRPPKTVEPPRRGGQTTRAGLTAQGGRSDRPGRSRQEASQKRTHVGIARLASRLSKVAVVGHRSDGENLKTSKFALERHVSLVV
jgi:hypothetical protein